MREIGASQPHIPTSAMKTLSLEAATPYKATVRDGTARIVVGTLSAAGASGKLGPLFDAVMRFVAGLIDDMAEKEPAPQPIACRKGCAFCCANGPIDVTPLEVLGIVHHVALAFDEGAMRDLLAAVMADDGRTVTPCPLLKDKQCSVYAARPLACRGINSYNATKCEMKMKFGVGDTIVTGWVHPWKISEAAREGIEQGAHELGLDGRALDLRRALKIAFADTDAVERWLAGEPVFEDAAETIGGEDADVEP